MEENSARREGPAQDVYDEVDDSNYSGDENAACAARALRSNSVASIAAAALPRALSLPPPSFPPLHLLRFHCRPQQTVLIQVRFGSWHSIRL